MQKNLVGENFGEPCIQVKAIGKENLANKLKSVHCYAKYIFSASVNIGEENLANGLRFAKFTNFPLLKFSHVASYQLLIIA